MTLPTPVKIVALACLALALGAAGVFVLLSSNNKAPVTSTPPKVVKVIAVSPHAAPAHHAKPKLHLDPNLPAPVRAGLERSREVVAFVFSPSSPNDRALLTEVRAGARAAHVGFVALDVQVEPVAAATFGWADSPADPAMFVVRRPGKIVFALQGPTDRETVAQAAARAR